MNKIREELLSLGIYPNVKGFNYLQSAVEIVMSSSTNHLKITQDIYPVVAKIYNDTASKVERSIRHVISKISTKDLLKLGFQRRPGNSEFIYLFAEIMSNKK